MTSSWYSEPRWTSSQATPPRTTSSEAGVPVDLGGGDRHHRAQPLAAGHDEVRGDLGQVRVAAADGVEDRRLDALAIGGHRRQREQRGPNRGVRHGRKASSRAVIRPSGDASAGGDLERSVEGDVALDAPDDVAVLPHERVGGRARLAHIAVGIAVHQDVWIAGDPVAQPAGDVDLR